MIDSFKLVKAYNLKERAVMSKYSKLKDRSETPSYKSNKGFLNKMFGDPDVMPLWVAGMQKLRFKYLQMIGKS